MPRRRQCRKLQNVNCVSSGAGVVVGAAIGIFVSFRTNQAYDRWWEGRKLWGRLINESRHWASQVTKYVEDPQVRTRLVHRHVAYVHALRCALRKEDPFVDDDFRARIAVSGDDPAALHEESNLGHALLDLQLEAVVALSAAGRLSELRVQSMDQSLRELVNVQGGCERIKATPIPYSYNILLHRIVFVYCFALPLGLVSIEGLGQYTPIVCLLISYAFFGLDAVGDEIEDPFGEDINDLPLATITRMIEVNLLERLGEEDMPPFLEPKDGVLR